MKSVAGEAQPSLTGQMSIDQAGFSAWQNHSEDMGSSKKKKKGGVGVHRGNKKKEQRPLFALQRAAARWGSPRSESLLPQRPR